MKHILTIIILTAFLQSCNLTYKKEAFSVTGTLIKNCEERTPLVGVEVSLDVLGHSYGTATTNARGEFHLTGEYEKKSGRLNIPIVAISHTPESSGFYGYKDLCALSGNVNGITLDTLYYDASNHVQITLETGSIQYTDKDTLFIGYSSPSYKKVEVQYNSYGDIYIKKYPGPFTTGILDTVIAQGHAHPKYHNLSSLAMNYYINNDHEWTTNYNIPSATYSNIHSSYPPTGGCDGITPVTLHLP